MAAEQNKITKKVDFYSKNIHHNWCVQILTVTV